MDYKLNFSHLSAYLLQQDKISVQEITVVFNGETSETIWDSLPQYSQFGVYYYLIGFSSKKRFLQMVLSCDGDEIYFLDIKVADLKEIREDFFNIS
jgi:hypothetical protein